MFLMISKGLVKSIGISNFNSEQIKDILEKGKIVPVTNQVGIDQFLLSSVLLKSSTKKQRSGVSPCAVGGIEVVRLWKVGYRDSTALCWL